MKSPLQLLVLGCSLAVLVALLSNTAAQQPVIPSVEKAAVAKLAAAPPAETGLRIFQLVHANSQELASTLQPLFANPPEMRTLLAVDMRTNSIIARGPNSELQVLEAVLLRLDEKAPENKAAAVSPRND